MIDGAGALIVHEQCGEMVEHAQSVAFYFQRMWRENVKCLV